MMKAAFAQQQRDSEDEEEEEEEEDEDNEVYDGRNEEDLEVARKEANDKLTAERSENIFDKYAVEHKIPVSHQVSNFIVALIISCSINILPCKGGIERAH